MAHTELPPVRLERAVERECILSLLRCCGLPVEDLDTSHPVQFLVMEEEGHLFGCVGIEEVTKEHALVRSLAVDPKRRGASIGSRLLEAAETLSRRRGIHEAYLLTLTAEAFFAHRGYRRVERTVAPDGIAKSTEFAFVCPASSAFMMKRLRV